MNSEIVDAQMQAALDTEGRISDEQSAIIIEAVLLCHNRPLSIRHLVGMFPKHAMMDEQRVKNIIEQLQEKWKERGIQLLPIANGYTFRTKPQLAVYLSNLQAPAPAKLSRALYEVLAIIAYKQPVTRGDIEQIRGVKVSASQMQSLEELEWICEAGVRETPGRPRLYKTTNKFLEDLSMSNLSQLLPLDSFEVQDQVESNADTQTEADTEIQADADVDADNNNSEDGVNHENGETSSQRVEVQAEQLNEQSILTEQESVADLEDVDTVELSDTKN